MPIPADLEKALDRFLDTLPFYKRWAIKAALALTQPKAAAVGCLILVAIVFLVSLGAIAYADSCASGKLPKWACP